MKTIDLDNLEQPRGRRLSDGDTFAFRCHPRVSCFNRCCRNLNLFLYPYDVLRLRSNLGISSDAFLDRYVDVVLRPSTHFPEVVLRMAEDREKTCPFLEDAGCSVYPDRPDTCRTFPVEQGAIFDGRSGKAEPVRFFRPPDFCMGRHEEQVWTPASWARDQEALVYNRMTLRWAELRRLFDTDPWGAEGPSGARAKMAFMAAYNVDRFKDFVFRSTFLDRFRVKPALLKRIRRDDAALLGFGFQWVKLFLWGIRTDGLGPRR